MNRMVAGGIAVFVLMCGRVVGQAPAAPLESLPPAERVAALQAEAKQLGWGPVSLQLRTIALARYGRQASDAQDWYYLFRWANLLAESENEAVNRWAQAERQVVPAGATLPPTLAPGPESLGDLMPADLQAYVMGSHDFSNQFFTLLSPLDQSAMVVRILAALWQHNPDDFRQYANLALAIAVVYDVPPPSDWPHGQVSPQVLPRRLAPPVEIFDFFVRSDRTGPTLESLQHLPAADLKFVVDTCAPLSDLVWAQQHVNTALADLPRLYDAVRYRRERLQANVLMWPGPSYRLADILRDGGICVDQAYFASTVGKAKGVPTLLFRGAGLDGRHAWFGYLGANGHWHLDCGRYADQRFVSGLAFDPQTWTNISDHELKFLSEGFRRLPLYQSSQVQQQFAGLYFSGGDYASAARAARSAVNVEPRNLDAWYLLIASLQALRAEPTQVEGVLQQAAQVFQNYPDLWAGFETMLSRSLRARGDASLADQIERNIASRYQGSRVDISVQQAQDILQRSLAQGDLNNGIRTYYSVLASYGRGGGIDFFDRIVRPFVERLLQQDRANEALQAVAQARQTLHVEPNSQLDGELNQLTARVQSSIH